MTSGDFTGNWQIIPNAIANITSAEAYMAFSFIYTSVRKNFYEKEIFLSKTTICDLLGTKYSGNNALKELEGLRLLTVTSPKNQTSFYIINWEEIKKVHDFTSRISYYGIIKLRKVTHPAKDKYIPFSELSEDIVNEIKSEFYYQPEFIKDNGEGVNIEPLKEEKPVKSDETGSILNHSDSNWVNIDPQTSAGGSKSYLQDNPTRSILNHSIKENSASHYITEEENGEIVLTVNLSNAESIIADKIGITKVLMNNAEYKGWVNIDLPVPEGGSKSYQQNDKGGSILTYRGVDFDPSKYIEENKEDSTERSEGYIKGEEQTEDEIKNEDKDKDVLLEKNQNNSIGNLSDSSNSIEPTSLSYSAFNKILDKAEEDKKLKDFSDKEKSQELLVQGFLNMRKSENFQLYEEFEFSNIIKEPSLHQLPEEVFIQEVWSAIQDTIEAGLDDVDDEGNIPEVQINGYEFDAWSFVKNIFERVYKDMLEENEISGNFNLKSWEAASIFDFELKENKDGEQVFVIDSSKIRNIGAKAKRAKKINLPSSEIRRLNYTYMDNLIEIAETYKGNNKAIVEHLSDMDIAMWRLKPQMEKWIKDKGEGINTKFFLDMVDEAIAGLDKVTQEDLLKCLNMKESPYRKYNYREDYILAENMQNWNREHVQDSDAEYRTWDSLSEDK